METNSTTYKPYTSVGRRSSRREPDYYMLLHQYAKEHIEQAENQEKREK